MRWEIENLKKVVSESTTKVQVIRKLGLSEDGGNYKTLMKNVNKYEIDISHFHIDIDSNFNNFQKRELTDILVENSPFNTTHLKERLFKEGLKKRECELCGQDEFWFGSKMALILDHINGVNNDNRFKNLRIVCPNCNATLPTHCTGKRIKKEKQ